MGGHVGHLEHIRAAVGIEGILDAVLAKAYVYACCQQFLHPGDAPANGLLIQAALKHQVGDRVGDDVHLGPGDLFDDIVCVMVVIGGQGAGMAGGDPAFPTPLDGLVRHHFQGAVEGVVGLIHMHVDIRIVLFRNVKAQLHMGQAIRRGFFIGRHTAHDGAAVFHGLVHQLIAAGVLDNALLGEGDDLDVHHILKLFLQLGNAAQGLESADGVHIHMGAHEQGAVFQGLVHHVAGALQHVLVGIGLFLVPNDLNGFLQGAGFIFAHHVEDVHLIQMDVGIDEGRGHQCAPRVDDAIGLLAHVLAHRLDQAAVDGDVH